MSLYEYDPADAERFANAVGIKTRHRNRQLEFVFCPYCHGGGKDKSTFYISMETGQFECKRAGCGRKGNMITLARDFANVFELSSDITRYFNTNNYNNRFKRFKKREIEVKDKAIEYCDSRDIPEEIVRKYELTVKDDSVLVFPFKDENGEIRFIKYRNMEYIKGETKGSKEWCEKDCMPILFGMYQCNLQNKTLVMTEGQMDSLSLAAAGIENAVSVPTGANGFTWVPYCWNWLQNFEELIIFGDCEKGHISLVDDMSKRFNRKVRVVRIEDYHGYKDANDILRNMGPEYLLQAVRNAKELPDEHLKLLSEVERVDIESMPSVKTSFNRLNRVLSGGLHFGQLVILTGTRGTGKSTLASQLALDALKIVDVTENRVLFYSGELMDFYFRDWLDRQLLGKDKNEITGSDIDLANKFYGDRMYLYQSSRKVDKSENDMELLLKTIEKSITQNGVRFIFLDNLMTAISSNQNDSLYQVQSDFVGKLAEICRAYNAIILLVVHPRKQTGWKTADVNDDISGSADITNKADIVLWYQRPDSKSYADSNSIPDRELVVCKNRLTGKITKPGTHVPLWFDDKSKRISETKGDFSNNYLNADDVERWQQVEFDDENPFEVISDEEET